LSHDAMTERYALAACTLLPALVASLLLISAQAEAEPLDVAILSQGGLVRGEWNLTARATGEATSVTFSIDDGPESPMAISGDGDFTARVDTTALADGVHSVVVAALGPNGTHAFAGVGLDVDNSPPSVDVRWAPIRNVSGDMPVEVSVRDAHLDGAVASLAVGNVTVRTFPVPSTGVPGEFRLEVDTLGLENRTYAMHVSVVDGAGNVNISKVREFTVKNHPDLTLVWLNQFTLSNPLIVQKMYNFTFEVTNAGTVAADGFAVGLYRSGHLVGTLVHNRTLLPGAKVRVSMDWMPNTKGDSDMRVVVDPDNVITELSESNNDVNQWVRVTQGQGSGCLGVILVMAFLLPGVVVAGGRPKERPGRL